LGPIAMLIEQVIGIYDIDASCKIVRWKSHLDSRHGIKNLKFSNITTSMIKTKNTLTVISNGEYNLIFNDSSYSIQKGEQEITLL
jgi:hypothetical protein